MEIPSPTGCHFLRAHGRRSYSGETFVAEWLDWRPPPPFFSRSIPPPLLRLALSLTESFATARALSLVRTDRSVRSDDVCDPEEDLTVRSEHPRAGV